MAPSVKCVPKVSPSMTPVKKGNPKGALSKQNISEPISKVVQSPADLTINKVSVCNATNPTVGTPKDNEVQDKAIAKSLATSDYQIQA